MTQPSRASLRTASMAVVLASLACSLAPRAPAPATPSVPPIGTPAPTPTAAPSPGATLVLLHQGSFALVQEDGTLLETRPADGLDYARPNTAQVVGEDIYYVRRSPEGGSVVRRVGPDGSTDLEFTSASGIDALTFSVAADGTRIAWATTSFAGGAPFSRLWAAGIDGSDAVQVGQTDPADAIAEYYVLEAVRWLADGDLVYAWQVTGIGGYILFFGWSSLYRFHLQDGSVIELTGPPGDGAAPCWTSLTDAGDRVLGACAGSAQMVERTTASGVETVFPLLPDQGQAGAGAFSPSGGRLAYAIARSNPDDEFGQLMVVEAEGSSPRGVASQALGAFDRLIWLDETRLAAGYWQADGTRVDVIGIDGSRIQVGEGSLIGVIRR